MSNIEDYIILGEERRYTLRQQILSYIQDGYCPYGQPYATPETENNMQEHCQAMIKYKSSKSVDEEDLR